MIRKIYLQSILFFSVFLMIITGSVVYAHGPGGGSGGENFMGNYSYGMMGGHMIFSNPHLPYLFTAILLITTAVYLSRAKSN